MKTENLGITTLRTQTKLCTTDGDKAQAFNEQFQSGFFLQVHLTTSLIKDHQVTLVSLI